MVCAHCSCSCAHIYKFLYLFWIDIERKVKSELNAMYNMFAVFIQNIHTYIKIWKYTANISVEHIPTWLRDNFQKCWQSQNYNIIIIHSCARVFPSMFWMLWIKYQLSGCLVHKADNVFVLMLFVSRAFIRWYPIDCESFADVASPATGFDPIREFYFREWLGQPLTAAETETGDDVNTATFRI